MNPNPTPQDIKHTEHTKTAQSTINAVWSVGSCHDDDLCPLLESIHQCQKLWDDPTFDLTMCLEWQNVHGKHLDQIQYISWTAFKMGWVIRTRTMGILACLSACWLLFSFLPDKVHIDYFVTCPSGALLMFCKICFMFEKALKEQE